MSIQRQLREQHKRRDERVTCGGIIIVEITSRNRACETEAIGQNRTPLAMPTPLAMIANTVDERVQNDGNGCQRFRVVAPLRVRVTSDFAITAAGVSEVNIHKRESETQRKARREPGSGAYGP